MMAQLWVILLQIYFLGTSSGDVTVLESSASGDRQMTDMVSPSRRSEIMRNIKPRNSSPEIYVRSRVHRMGFRFRLHVRALPGTPDLVFPRHRKVIFVNGCFWHGHANCRKAAMPKSNKTFWSRKLKRNRERDGENLRALRKLRWQVLTVWQCEMKKPERLYQKLRRFLRES